MVARMVSWKAWSTVDYWVYNLVYQLVELMDMMWGIQTVLWMVDLKV